ncbi:GrlR family regulatory protein [Halomonas sp. H5]|uniref:GrlR family regulatory protein n=1 Tax=Halomonas sp. H5 TaxID=3423910 RepID=UPI003D366FF1
MIDGLYAVHFRAAGDEGTGVVSVTNGSINGGDYGYAYQGRILESGQGVSTTLSVWRFNPHAKSVFGQAQSFELELSGPTSEKGFELTGNIKGSPAHKLNVSGRFLKPLV